MESNEYTALPALDVEFIILLQLLAFYIIFQRLYQLRLRSKYWLGSVAICNGGGGWVERQPEVKVPEEEEVG